MSVEIFPEIASGLYRLGWIEGGEWAIDTRYLARGVGVRIYPWERGLNRLSLIYRPPGGIVRMDTNGDGLQFDCTGKSLLKLSAFREGLSFELILGHRPAETPGGYCRFALNVEDPERLYHFAPQLWLSKLERAEGVYRPPEAAGSIAIYHRRNRDYLLGRYDYATGKVAQLSRPIGGPENVAGYWALDPGPFGLLAIFRAEAFASSPPWRVTWTLERTAAGASAAPGPSAALWLGAEGAPVTPREDARFREIYAYTWKDSADRPRRTQKPLRGHAYSGRPYNLEMDFGEALCCFDQVQGARSLRNDGYLVENRLMSIYFCASRKRVMPIPA